MFSRLFLLPVLAALASPLAALDIVVNDFRVEFSNLASDTANLDPTWGDTLKIVPKEYRYVSEAPFLLSNSGNPANGFGNGKAGGTPVVVSPSKGVFKCAYIGWDESNSMKPADDGAFTLPAHILMRTIVIGEGYMDPPPGALKIAGNEYRNRPTPPVATLPPAYFNFVAEGNRYAAFWSSMDPGKYLKRTTHKESAGGGSPNDWGRYILNTAPGDTVTAAGLGKISAAMIPGTNGTQTVMAFESSTSFGNERTKIRWENIETGTTASAEFTHVTNKYGQDYAISADSAGNVVVLWREGPDYGDFGDLYIAAYDASRAVIHAPTLLQAAVSLNDGTTNVHLYRPYAIANITKGNFMVSFTRGGVAYYQTLAVPFGAQAYAEGPAVKVSSDGEIANYPGIAVNQDMVLFGWFAKSGVNHSLKGALYGRSGNGINAASRKTLTLSSETVAFDSVGSGWYKYHYFKAPSLALDSLGNIAAAYDNQFHAKLALTSNYAVFHDSADFTSRVRTLADLLPPIPLESSTDSIEYVSYRLVTRTSDGSPAVREFKIAVSKDGNFTIPGTGFQDFPIGRRTLVEAFRYNIVLKAHPPAFTTQTKVDSLIMRYNVKPRRPVIDSIKIGSAALGRYDSNFAYSVLPRKDSIRLVVSGVDVDDRPAVKFFLFLGDRAIDSTVSTKDTPGKYRAVLALKPPDTLPSPLNLSIRTRDSSGWVSLPMSFRPEFLNRAPAETVTVVRNRGSDSLNVFRPSGGGADTVVPVASQLLVLQTGDSATALFRLGDLNDDTVTFRLRRNSDTVTSRRVAVKDLLTLKFTADTAAPLVDTLTAMVFDRDDTVSFRFLVRPNRLPAIDSLFHASYKGRDSVRLAGPFDVVRNFAADSGIQVPSGLPAVVKTGVSDRDLALGDGVRINWSVFAPKVPFPAGCAAGNLVCYDTTFRAAGDSLIHAFALPEEYLTVRATDSGGAFVQRKVKLEFQIIDTSGAASFAAGLKALVESLDFILGGKVSSDTITAEVTSLGNIPLQILSATTGRNDSKWLDLKFNWESPGTPPKRDSLSINGRTDSNAVKAGSPITVAPGAKMTMTFKVTTDSLRGDSVLVDTLVLRTNDLSNPMIRIPIRIAYNDLPVLRISNRGGTTAPAGGYNDAGLPSFLPVRTSLVFAFSEPVRIPDPASRIRIYSYLDSLKNPSGYRAIPGTFEHRLAPRPLPRRSALGRAGNGAFAGAGGIAFADTLADTLIFRPAYDRASDSLKVRPRPGAFIHRDVLHIEVTNGVTDRAGNALDLRLDRAARAPNSVDTIFPVRVDTGFFRVVSTSPAKGEQGWDSEKPIKVRFNRKLAIPPPRGQDSATLLDFDALRGDSNKVFWVQSRWRGDRRFDLQFLSVEDGDSTLVFRTRPKFPAFDTVTVTMAGLLSDLNGLTLDGNSDGFPSGFYDSADTADHYRFSFQTKDQEFYIFPNPYRHSDARHREKGTVTFKNVNSLPGFVPGREVVLRIHTMTGDLIFSSRTATRASSNPFGTWASLDWDLRNNAGNLTGSGVYVYTLISGGTKVLRKGKVAVIR